MFTVIPDAAAVMVSKGIYKQAKIYDYRGKLYASHGSGFILLKTAGTTSLPNIRWEEIEVPWKQHKRNNVGHLVNPETFKDEHKDVA